MDLRTKFALAFVSLSLVSMGLLGAFAYQTASELLRQISVRQLDALADSKARDLAKVQQGWKDQLSLLVYGDELHDILEDYKSGDSGAMPQLIHLVDHVAGAVKNVELIRISDRQNRIMSWGHETNYADVKLPEKAGEIAFGGAFLDEQRGLKVVLSTLLSVPGDSTEQRVTGHLEMVFDAKDLNTVTDNYTGLGETGEVMIVALRDNDTVMVLNQLRHETSTLPREFPLAEASDAIRHVLSGKSGVIEGFVDYRGEKVWAATRYLPDLNWGIIVKVDATEEEMRAETLMGEMFDIGIALSAFAIIIGTLLGFYFARPIHDLAVLVGRIRHGETELRSPVKGDDELAYLSESLNELLDHMQGIGPPKDSSHDV